MFIYSPITIDTEGRKVFIKGNCFPFPVTKSEGVSVSFESQEDLERFKKDVSRLEWVSRKVEMISVELKNETS